MKEMKQSFKVLKNIYEDFESQTPKEISNKTKIANPTVRKHCKYWLELGVIKQSPMPLESHRPEYYTTDALIKKYITSLKKEKRKLQCKIADKEYRIRKRNAYT